MKNIRFVCLLSFGLYFVACAPNNVVQEKALEKTFDSAGVVGSFALYDNGTGQFNVHNLVRYRDSSLPVGNSFRLVLALVGIETGTLLNEKNFLPWEGEQFVAIEQQLGRDTLRFWTDSLRYGKSLAKGPNDSSLFQTHRTIRPDEQLGLAKKLFFGGLPFQKRTQELVRKALLREDNANYRLAYLQGGSAAGTQAHQWVMGWIEENRHPYFFVLEFDSPAAPDLNQKGLDLLKKCLAQQGLLAGKR